MGRGAEHVVAHVVAHVQAFFSLWYLPGAGQQKEAAWKGKTSYLQVAIDSGGIPNQRADRFGVPGRLISAPGGLVGSRWHR